jgi:hypothetical protein
MDEAFDRRTRLFLGIVIILILLGIVAVLLVLAGDGNDEVVDHETPCEEQAPPDCLRETIEQAVDSQFVHYCYCACMTTEGLSKGYVANRDLSQKVGGRLVAPWDESDGR